MIIPLSLLLALAGPSRAQTVDWTHDAAATIGARIAMERKKAAKPRDDGSKPLSVVEAPDSASLTPEQLACQPDIIAGFKRIFGMAGNGQYQTEAAFRVDFVDGKRQVIPAPFTNETMQTHLSIIPGTTIAIAHTHPAIFSAPYPSEQDEKSPVPNFVVTPWELWVTKPGASGRQPRSRLVRRDWMKPCPVKP